MNKYNWLISFTYQLIIGSCFWVIALLDTSCSSNVSDALGKCLGE